MKRPSNRPLTIGVVLRILFLPVVTFFAMAALFGGVL